MLSEIVKLLEQNQSKVLDWLEMIAQKYSPPVVYTSCDVRNAGYKLAVVDTNLFPAGWNNLCPSYRKKSAVMFREYFAKYHSSFHCILIVAEEHTRNSFYFSNLKALSEILNEAGMHVFIGTVNPDVTDSTIFKTADDEDLEIHPIHRRDNSIYVGDEKMCAVLFNNDFSDGVPEILEGINQPFMPNPNLGWHMRRKSEHFRLYNELIDDFANLLGFDPWFMKTRYSVEDHVNINDENDRKRLADSVDKLISEISDDYKNFGVEREPVVFIKNDSGTYGMGVISVKSGQEILELNRKNRNKLSVGKESVPITSFLIQEGVPTIDKIKGHTAEPVIYLAGAKACGGFFRVHAEKSDEENLNSPGMKFVKLCFEEILGYENESLTNYNKDCLDILYSTVATLASLAASVEQSNLNNNA